MSACRWLRGDVFDRLAELPDNSVDLIVTSPPFLALRSYLPADHPDKHKEIGSEPTPAAFLSTLLALTREWRRILAPHGSIAVELGDTYSGSGGAGGDYTNDGGFHEGQPTFRQARDRNGWPLAKSLCLIPSLYAGSLAYGHNLLNPADRIKPWRIRNLIVWHRPNPPVGALGDKVRPSTSYITTACVSDRRWFDLDAERQALKFPDAMPRATLNRGAPGHHTDPANDADRMAQNPAGAPPLDCWIDSTAEDVWTIPTAPYKGAHYATYPPALPRRLINLMCPREVCVVCGEPRRRRLYKAQPWDQQPALAAHIKSRRQKANVTTAQINERLNQNATAEHWERTDEHGARVPTPDDWDIIKPWLGLSDEFDEFITGRRASMIDYVRDGRQLEPDERRADYGRGGLGLPDRTQKANRVAPDEWTDCGHSVERPLAFRRGVVLDPFAGSGTTLAAAAELGRDAIGIDLDSRNLELARQRLGLFLEEETA
jgi:DNA modification methylase